MSSHPKRRKKTALMQLFSALSRNWREVAALMQATSLFACLSDADPTIYSRYCITKVVSRQLSSPPTDQVHQNENSAPPRSRIREKLEDNPSQPKHLLTVWGVGYKFVEWPITQPCPARGTSSYRISPTDL